MNDRILLAALSSRGRARVVTGPGGRHFILATHPISLLHLIERQAQLEIRVSAHEADVLRNWPLWPLAVEVAHNTAEGWAEAAVTVLRRGPPRLQRRTGWLLLALAASVSFALAWWAMQRWFG